MDITFFWEPRFFSFYLHVHFNFVKVSCKLVTLSNFYRIYKCLIQGQSGINSRKLNAAFINLNPLPFSHYYLSIRRINDDPTSLKFTQNSSSQQQLDDTQPWLLKPWHTCLGSTGTSMLLRLVHRVNTKEGYPVLNTFTVSKEFHIPSHGLSVTGVCYTDYEDKGTSEFTVTREGD